MAFSSNIPLQTNQLSISLDVPSPRDEQDFMNFLSLFLKRISDAMNTKEGSLYLPIEVATFIQYFDNTNTLVNRNVYRKVFDMVLLKGGVITAGTTNSFPHGIDVISTPTHIYGTATTSTGKYFPLPYVSLLATSGIQIYLDSTNVTLITGSTIDGGAGNTLTQAYIVFEYTKN